MTAELERLIAVPEAEPMKDVLTIPEVAEHLRCSRAHVYNAINGKVQGVEPLPVIRLGRRKLVRRSTLETWKKANETS